MYFSPMHRPSNCSFIPAAFSLPSQIVKHELQKDFGEGADDFKLRPWNMHHPRTAEERGCDGMWTDKTTFFLSTLESDKEGLEKQQETRYHVKPLLSPSSFLSPPQLCQDPGVERPMIEFPLKFIRTWA